jgi:hypothetical protein
MGTSDQNSESWASPLTETHPPARAMASIRILRPRDLQWYRACENGTEAVLYFMVVFSPWAFGTMQPWAIRTMDAAGYLLGLLLALKLWVRWWKGYRPARWETQAHRDEQTRELMDRAAPASREGCGPQAPAPKAGCANTAASAERGDALVQDQLGAPGRRAVVRRHKRHKRKPGWEWRLTAVLIGLTAAILAYCLTSALNASATYQPQDLSFVYHQHFIKWLPHSLDSASTWAVFWDYLALACGFLALRDWLPGKSDREQRAEYADSSGARFVLRVPDRLRRLLWVMAVNGGLLALEGIAQRLEGSGYLLFVLKPRINQAAEAQFGPYAYRGNAAAYFNLLWPVCLGFWWTLERSRERGSRHHVLLLCAGLMAACPIICTSRAGAVVDLGLLTAGTAYLLLSGLRPGSQATERDGSAFQESVRRARRRSRSGGEPECGSGLRPSSASTTYPERRQDAAKRSLTLPRRTRSVLLLGFCAGALVLGYVFGWKKLQPRWSELARDYAVRDDMSEQARPMAADYPVFGTGPGTFETVFDLYRISTETRWPAQIHNDWLETRITFGWAGSALIALAFATALARWFLPGGIHGGRRFVVLTWLALAGCLAHARYDFPFQIYSILLLFLMLCAILSDLTRGVESQRS